ncbi:MAG: hypothetical protein KatS3mg010_1280 [Acidimicrobiia bacterium]|nr:MAG: hypothetical protein KatS3mg010_1280 [Acidimicrobiia bacterium]
MLLNLKDLVLRCSAEEPVTLRLDKRGPGEVRAGDIQTTAEVEILNPDLYIATVNASGRLALDLTVEQGRGYLSAERNKRTTTIGVIPVDAIYSPVRRVSFSVEPTRVEQATNYDQLTLEIETDGSITPRDALASAGDTLRKLIDLIAELSEEPRGLELGEVASPTSTSPDLDLPIEELDLSERPAQLPQARARRHDRPARAEDRGRPARDHELRLEVARGSDPEARRARAVAAGEGVGDVPAPKKGPRFGSGPAHQKQIMANLAASLFVSEVGHITTTEAKAKALRPYVEKLITKAKRGKRPRPPAGGRRDPPPGRRAPAVLRDRPPLRGPQRRLHADPETRPAPRRQRADGAHRARLNLVCRVVAPAGHAGTRTGSDEA